VPFEQIDIMKLDHRSPAHNRLNPMQQVPVLVLDDGTTIAESVAICRYSKRSNLIRHYSGAEPRAARSSKCGTGA
jgi:glutathione S-transferase